jgi:pyroglutamyl-peptidase
MKVLVTGFGPFPGVRINPTTALMQRLAKRRHLTRPGLCIATHVFETRYDAVDAELPKLLAKHKPDALIMFGIAARTPYLRIETCAHHAQSVLFADAGGRLAPAGHGGAHKTMKGRAPFAQLLVAARRSRAPARLSRDAGRYLCNYLYAQALIADRAPPVVVFVHVPKLRALGRPRTGVRRQGITLDDLVRAAEAMLALVPAMVRRSSLLSSASR